MVRSPPTGVRASAHRNPRLLIGAGGRRLFPLALVLSDFWYPHAFLTLSNFSMQSFFGFGQSADIEITLDGAETRKTADIKSEDGKKERHLLYYDGETVSGKVCLLPGT